MNGGGDAKTRRIRKWCVVCVVLMAVGLGRRRRRRRRATTTVAGGKSDDDDADDSDERGDR